MTNNWDGSVLPDVHTPQHKARANTEVMIRLGEGRGFATISGRLNVCEADRLQIFPPIKIFTPRAHFDRLSVASTINAAISGVVKDARTRTPMPGFNIRRLGRIMMPTKPGHILDARATVSSAQGLAWPGATEGSGYFPRRLSATGSRMECGRCAELELTYLNRTEEFISLVERQGRMFRNGEARVGRELDDAIIATRAAMHESLRTWAEHRESHFLMAHA